MWILCVCCELDSDIDAYATQYFTNSAISPDPSGTVFENSLSSKMTLSNFEVKRPSHHHGRTIFMPIPLSIKISYVAFAEFPDHHVF